MRGRGQVIVVLKIWKICNCFNVFGPNELWLETESGLLDFRFNPCLEEFRQSVNSSDPYVRRHKAIGPL
ncbi:unnamed protein product [Eruca vesicaria subsp. sativa]|uniref:Uncharacterized protein n=1 Tax=Eruca vesicaria subsp. sativa TaxID=29727 RepID=A0ABC8K6U3_ERUVS|nr:unnamed protein product [Eruca vesicaria subsp. sativa]